MKERYLVALMDGTTANVVAESFVAVIAKYGESNIWMIQKLDFVEDE